MNDQLQTAKDWLGDLSKIVSRQKTKEDYEYAKSRTDALDWLINRVEELEKELNGAEHRYGYKQMYKICNRDYATLNSEKNRYKQALEEIKKEAINHKQKGFAIQHWAVIKQIDIALEESQ